MKIETKLNKVFSEVYDVKDENDKRESAIYFCYKSEDDGGEPEGIVRVYDMANGTEQVFVSLAGVRSRNTRLGEPFNLPRDRKLLAEYLKKNI